MKQFVGVGPASEDGPSTGPLDPDCDQISENEKQVVPMTIGWEFAASNGPLTAGWNQLASAETSNKSQVRWLPNRNRREVIPVRVFQLGRRG